MFPPDTYHEQSSPCFALGVPRPQVWAIAEIQRRTQLRYLTFPFRFSTSQKQLIPYTFLSLIPFMELKLHSSYHYSYRHHVLQFVKYFKINSICVI